MYPVVFEKFGFTTWSGTYGRRQRESEKPGKKVRRKPGCRQMQRRDSMLKVVLFGGKTKWTHHKTEVCLLPSRNLHLSDAKLRRRTSRGVPFTAIRLWTGHVSRTTFSGPNIKLFDLMLFGNFYCCKNRRQILLSVPNDTENRPTN